MCCAGYWLGWASARLVLSCSGHVLGCVWADMGIGSAGNLLRWVVLSGHGLGWKGLG